MTHPGVRSSLYSGRQRAIAIYQSRGASPPALLVRALCGGFCTEYGRSCATGNGFEHIDPSITTEFVGIDISQLCRRNRSSKKQVPPRGDALDGADQGKIGGRHDDMTYDAGRCDGSESVVRYDSPRVGRMSPPLPHCPSLPEMAPSCIRSLDGPRSIFRGRWAFHGGVP